MSITQTDIQKLASLSRMKLTEEEQATFAQEIDSILGYVEQIKEVSGGGVGGAVGSALGGALKSNAEKAPHEIPHRNFLREDIADTELNPDSRVLVESAPDSLEGYVKVKKILN